MKDIDNYVVPKLAPKWRQLGTQLNIRQHLMDIIEHDHPNDCESCCSEMFSGWLDSNPAASWEDIITAEKNLSSNGMHQHYNHIATYKGQTKLKTSFWFSRLVGFAKPLQIFK